MILLERKMLKLLFKDAIKTPGKLLALCLVVYLATISFFVLGFVLLLAARWLQKHMQQKAKALEAAEAEAAKAKVTRTETAQPVVAAALKVAAAANDNVAVAPAPKRQYAKSAVVIPFKTGTQ
jgi:flagellar biosynthesis component FlhA